MHKNEEVSNIEQLKEKIRNLWSRILWSYHTYFWIFCCFLLSPWKLLLSTLNPCYSLVMAYYSYKSREYEGRWRFSDTLMVQIYPYTGVWTASAALLCQIIGRDTNFSYSHPHKPRFFLVPTPHIHTHTRTALCAVKYDRHSRSPGSPQFFQVRDAPIKQRKEVSVLWVVIIIQHRKRKVAASNTHCHITHRVFWQRKALQHAARTFGNFSFLGENFVLRPAAELPSRRRVFR